MCSLPYIAFKASSNPFVLRYLSVINLDGLTILESILKGFATRFPYVLAHSASTFRSDSCTVMKMAFTKNLYTNVENNLLGLSELDKRLIYN